MPQGQGYAASTSGSNGASSYRSPAQHAMARYKALEADRSQWLAHWREIAHYMMPRTVRSLEESTSSGTRNAYRRIYDNTASRALLVLGAGMMGGLTSPARPWFRLSLADEDLTERYDVKQWLSQVTRIMTSIFRRSNTYRALHQYYLQLGGFGTSSGLLLGNYDRVIHHYPLVPGEYCLSMNWDGYVDTIARTFQRRVREVVEEFGKRASPETRHQYDRGNYDQWVTLLHLIEPRAQRDARKRDAINMPWASTIWEMGGRSADHRRLHDVPLRESGFRSFPGLCPRWEQIGNDVYGHSPGMFALGDTMSLQHAQVRKAQVIDNDVDPALQVPTMFKNREVQRLPGGITYTDGMAGAKIERLFNGTLTPDLLLEDIRDVRGRIQSAFYVDMFLMISQSDNTQKTATEIAERHEEKLLMLGPTLERLHDELLDGLIGRTFESMVEGNLVPPPPPSVEGSMLQVELVSMLAQAQRAVGTNSVDRWVANLGVIAGFKPEVADKLNADKWADLYADMLGVDPDYIVPGEQVAFIRQQRAEQQQAAQQAMVAAEQAKATQSLANSPTRGGMSTALDDVIENFSGYGGI